MEYPPSPSVLQDGVSLPGRPSALRRTHPAAPMLAATA